VTTLGLEGMTAIVTGAASGIGRATAKIFSDLGVSVLCADLNAAGCDEVVASIRHSSPGARSFTVDISDEAGVASMCDAAIETWGKLDIIVNCAFLSDPDIIRHDGAVGDLQADIWDRSMAVNARGPMLVCKHAVRVMLPRQTGSIVNVSSTHSIVGELGATSYGMAKAAVNSLTRYVATQYGKSGIRCNTVVPGPTRTPSLLNNVSEGLQAILEGAALTPFLGEPEDLAHAIVFVSSPWARYITGEAICVNGGRTIHAPTFAQEMASAPGS